MSACGDRAEVSCQDVLELTVSAPVDVVVSTAALHWVTDHERMWDRLAQTLRPGGRLEIQCGGAGNIARVRAAIDAVAVEGYPELVGWSPWEFAAPESTERRLIDSGFASIHCWLTERPTCPEDATAFVRTSILTAHLDRLPEHRRAAFVDAVMSRVRLPLDYVRLNVSAVRAA